MPSIVSSSFILPCSHISQFKVDLRPQRDTISVPCITFGQRKMARDISSVTRSIHSVFRKMPSRTLKFIAREGVSSNNELYNDESEVIYDLGDQEGDIDTESPWEGAVIYKRNPSISHLEYCTTLERLGMGKLSTELSKSRASVMGLRVTREVKDFPLGTPVLISVDITRKKQKLRLDGIIRTVISLACNRCGEPAAQSIYSNFSLLLNEERFEEPDVINLGMIFGDSKTRTSGTGRGEYEEDDEDSVDLDDWLYFPPEEKEIDISKHIRDMVHVEITINVLCDPMCKGLCLKCGSNLNLGSCNCGKQEVKQKGYGPLGDLKERLQQT